MCKFLSSLRVCAVAGDHPPTDEEGYMEFAKSLAQKDIYEAIQQAEPVGPIYSYARTENVRRRYEEVNQPPLDQLSR